MIRVVVNGTFDVVHRGHIELLNYAKSLGDCLLVCIDTDSRVREFKGLARPVNNQEDRMFLLQNLKAVDRVALFGSDSELESLFEAYSPDVMVKGSDYAGVDYIGKKFCKSTVYYDRIEPYSSTAIIQSIASRR